MKENLKPCVYKLSKHDKSATAYFGSCSLLPAQFSRVSSYSGYCHVSSRFDYGAFTLSGRSFQDRSASSCESFMQSEPRHARTSVWALPISLAATFGIDVSFFSSGYLDVSVHRVPDLNLWIQLRTTEVFSARFPHSEIYGSIDICSSP